MPDNKNTPMLLPVVLAASLTTNLVSISLAASLYLDIRERDAQILLWQELATTQKKLIELMENLLYRGQSSEGASTGRST